MAQEAVGEGDFTVEHDRLLLAPVLMRAIRRKLLNLLRSQDILGYRALLNLQSVHLRGLDVEGFCTPVPGFETELDLNHLDSSSIQVEHFFYQNGFTSLNDTDSRGWFPIHYAAVGGDLLVINGLLTMRADMNCRTKKDHPALGFPPWISPLSICAFYKHNDAIGLLLSARARVETGLMAPPLMIAGHANNPEAIRLFIHAGVDPEKRNMFGFSPFEAACNEGSLEAMKEFLKAKPTMKVPSSALHLAMTEKGGNVVP